MNEEDVAVKRLQKPRKLSDSFRMGAHRGSKVTRGVFGPLGNITAMTAGFVVGIGAGMLAPVTDTIKAAVAAAGENNEDYEEEIPTETPTKRGARKVP